MDIVLLGEFKEQVNVLICSLVCVYLAGLKKADVYCDLNLHHFCDTLNPNINGLRKFLNDLEISENPDMKDFKKRTDKFLDSFKNCHKNIIPILNAFRDIELNAVEYVLEANIKKLEKLSIQLLSTSK